MRYAQVEPGLKQILGSTGAYLVTSFEGEPTPFAALDEAAPGGVDGHEGWLVRGAERTAVPRVAGSHVDFYRAVERWLLDGGPVPVEPADAVRTAEVLEAVPDRKIREDPDLEAGGPEICQAFLQTRDQCAYILRQTGLNHHFVFYVYNFIFRDGICRA